MPSNTSTPINTSAQDAQTLSKTAQNGVKADLFNPVETPSGLNVLLKAGFNHG